MLTKDSTFYDLNNNLPPTSSLKRNITTSYDINTTNYFSHINNNNKKEKETATRTNTQDNWKSYRYIYN